MEENSWKFRLTPIQTFAQPSEAVQESSVQALESSPIIQGLLLFRLLYCLTVNVGVKASS